jgi:hypothetical protein
LGSPPKQPEIPPARGRQELGCSRAAIRSEVCAPSGRAAGADEDVPRGPADSRHPCRCRSRPLVTALFGHLTVSRVYRAGTPLSPCCSRPGLPRTAEAGGLHAAGSVGFAGSHWRFEGTGDLGQAVAPLLRAPARGHYDRGVPDQHARLLPSACCHDLHSGRRGATGSSGEFVLLRGAMRVRAQNSKPAPRLMCAALKSPAASRRALPHHLTGAGAAAGESLGQRHGAAACAGAGGGVTGHAAAESSAAAGHGSMRSEWVPTSGRGPPPRRASASRSASALTGLET